MRRVTPVDRILGDLGSHDPGAERSAVRRLVALGPEAVGPLQRAISEKRNAHARAAAAAALARIAGSRSRRTLLGALDDATMVVRLRALRELDRHAWDDRVGRRVVGLVDDPSAGVRNNAIAILARRGQRSAAAAIARRLRDERWHVRQQAAAALGLIGGPRALSRLRPSVRDPRKAVREAAARSMARFERIVT
jgi:HEAT repeat protein